MINFFTTTASLGSGGIFTMEKRLTDDKDLKKAKFAPKSAISVVHDLNIKTLWNVESKFTSFFEAVQNCKAANLKYRFGIKFRVGDKEGEGVDTVNTEHKIIVFANGDAGYNDLATLFSSSKSYDSYNRLDNETLKKYWTSNLKLVIPFYDSYLFNNNLKFGNCLPDFPTTEIIYCVENNFLPFDKKMDKIVRAASSNILEAQTCYYTNSEDYKKFLTYRCMLAGTTFNKPNMDNMYSNNFYPKCQT